MLPAKLSTGSPWNISVTRPWICIIFILEMLLHNTVLMHHPPYLACHKIIVHFCNLIGWVVFGYISWTAQWILFIFAPYRCPGDPQNWFAYHCIWPTFALWFIGREVSNHYLMNHLKDFLHIRTVTLSWRNCTCSPQNYPGQGTRCHWCPLYTTWYVNWKKAYLISLDINMYV